MKYQKVKNLSELEVGDIIKSSASTVSYVVTGNYGSHVTAVRSQDVTNIDEWMVLRDNPTTEQDK